MSRAEEPRGPEACPCGGAEYARCCGRFLDGGERAETPEALMRSRFTAYVRGRAEYLWATHDPSTRPTLAELERAVVGATYHRLVVHEAAGDRVTFTAFHRGGVLRERSRFARADGAWRYVDGEVSGGPVAKNAPCPCGSGQKYKRCCGA